MSFLKAIFDALDKIVPAKRAQAHCDIPCGIYDPHLAQLAAHTVIRMNMLIAQLPKLGPNSKPEEYQDYVHKLSRYVDEKEEQAEICKKEIRIIWGDYFKPEHVQKFPEIHDLVWKVMKFGSKNKQEADIKAAEDLLDTINKLAEIFWATKAVPTVKVKAFYNTEHDIVLPKV